jgi:hypothetical protein
MIDDQVRPRLRELSGEPAVLSSRLLHCWGLGESQIAEKLDDLYASTNPSVAFLIKGPEVRVRISAKASSVEETSAMIAGVEEVVRERLGDAIFATDDETVDGLVESSLAQRGWSVDSFEICTHGLVASRLAAIAGFAGGVIRPSDGSPIDDVEAHAGSLMEALTDRADVTVVVGEMTEQRSDDGAASRRIGIAITTPETEVVTSVRALGNDERARTFAAVGAIHLLRKAIAI